MNCPRDEFFAGTGFAANQNRRIAAGDLGHSRQNRGERGRGADNLFENRGLVDFLSKRNVFFLQSLLGSLAIFDIGTRDIPTSDLSLVIANRVRTSQKPAVSSIALAQPQLQLVGRSCRESMIKIIPFPRPVIWMNERTALRPLPPLFKTKA